MVTKKVKWLLVASEK